MSGHLLPASLLSLLPIAHSVAFGFGCSHFGPSMGNSLLIAPYARVAYIFDGRDQEAVARARAEWQAAKAKGHAVSYWQQTQEGRWQQMA